MRAAVVYLSTYIVINIIMANAEQDLPPDGCMLVDIGNKSCDIGWVYNPDTGEFTAPVAVEPVV